MERGGENVNVGSNQFGSVDQWTIRLDKQKTVTSTTTNRSREHDTYSQIPAA